MTGGSVIDPLYLFARGSQGSNISYNAAVSVRRQIYASPGAHGQRRYYFCGASQKFTKVPSTDGNI